MKVTVTTITSSICLREKPREQGPNRESSLAKVLQLSCQEAGAQSAKLGKGSGKDGSSKSNM